MAASEQQVENLVGMLDAYATKGGHHLNVNVLNRDTLIDAQKHPAAGSCFTTTKPTMTGMTRTRKNRSAMPAIPGPPATGPFRTTATNRSRFSMETAPGSLAWS